MFELLTLYLIPTPLIQRSPRTLTLSRDSSLNYNQDLGAMPITRQKATRDSHWQQDGSDSSCNKQSLQFPYRTSPPGKYCGTAADSQGGASEHPEHNPHFLSAVDRRGQRILGFPRSLRGLARHHLAAVY